METNLNYQRRLAETLVTGLGVEAAMDFARENDWNGVLAQMRATSVPGGGGDARQANGRLRMGKGGIAARHFLDALAAPGRSPEVAAGGAALSTPTSPRKAPLPASPPGPWPPKERHGDGVRVLVRQ